MRSTADIAFGVTGQTLRHIVRAGRPTSATFEVFAADAGDDDTPEARRWRVLASEAQIVLHNHPWNAARAAAGKPPVNALWFWGGGVFPDSGAPVRSRHAQVATDDPTCQALAALATGVRPLPPAWTATDGDALFDLVALRDLRQLQAQWLRPALAALGRGALETLVLDDEDGRVLTLARRHRLRFWRRPLQWRQAEAAAADVAGTQVP